MDSTALTKSLMNNWYGVSQGDGRRRPIGVARSWEPKELHQRHHEILALKLLGASNKEIAERLSVTEVLVSSIINSSLGQSKLTAMRIVRDGGTIDVAREVAMMVGPALKVYNDILNSEDREIEMLKLKKKTADTVLIDLAGHGAPKRVEGSLQHTHLVQTSEALQELVRRGIEAGRASGLIVDAEEVEVVKD